MRVLRIVELNRLSETPVLVAEDAKGMVHVEAFETNEKDYLCKTACGAVPVYPRTPFYIIILNALKSVIKLAKPQRVVTTSPTPAEILLIKNDEYSSYPPDITSFEFGSVVH